MLQPPLPGEGKIILSLAGGCRFLPKPGPREAPSWAETLLTKRNPFVTTFRLKFPMNLAVYFMILLCDAP
jgi:hypothetical protein